MVLVHLKVVFSGDPRRHPARQGPLLVDGHLSLLESVIELKFGDSAGAEPTAPAARPASLQKVGVLARSQRHVSSHVAGNRTEL